MGKSIKDYFSIIEDPRKGRNVQHKLEDIIIISIIASIGGAEGFEEVEEFGQSKKVFFETILELPHGIPSHDTFRRVFILMNPRSFESCFKAWTTTLQEKKKGVVAFDGKTLRRSHDRAKGKKAIHMISAWSAENQIVLGQLAVGDKTNEITAIPELMDLLDIRNTVITIDAMGTQTEIAKKIRQKKADYILALKGNQGYLKELVESGFEKRKQDITHETIEKDHGRIEIRKCEVINHLAWMDEEKDRWTDLHSIIRVTSTREIKEEKNEETRYFISSIKDNAVFLSKSIREHWGIENKLHWTLDVAFREDEIRKRVGQSSENFAIVRRIALNLLKNEKTLKLGIKGKRLKAGWDNDYLMRILKI